MGRALRARERNPAYALRELVRRARGAGEAFSLTYVQLDGAGGDDDAGEGDDEPYGDDEDKEEM